MQAQHHSMADLFAQLGLPDDHASIDAFVRRHSPLPDSVELTAAWFWAPAQAAFLRAEHANDADWVGQVDSLDVLLRHGGASWLQWQEPPSTMSAGISERSGWPSAWVST